MVHNPLKLNKILCEVHVSILSIAFIREEIRVIYDPSQKIKTDWFISNRILMATQLFMSFFN